MNKYQFLQEQYNLISVPSYIENKKEVVVSISCCIDDLEDIKYASLVEMKHDSKERLIGKLRNSISFITDEIIDVEAIEADLKILKDVFNLTFDYSWYYNELLSIISDDNYTDVYRLYKFTKDNQQKNFSYLENKRISTDYAYKGISYNPRGNALDTRDVFGEIFYSKFNEINSSKTLAKVKKM